MIKYSANAETSFTQMCGQGHFRHFGCCVRLQKYGPRL